MSSPRHHIARALILAAVGLGGCVGEQHVSTSGTGGGSVGAGTAGGGGAGGVASDDPLLPARIRRLTNAEYAASVFALLGVDTAASVAGFPRDATQTVGFSVNDAQIVSSVLASQLDSSAQALIAAARQNGQFDVLAPCGDPIGNGETCARSFVQSFGARAYRRPLTGEDIDPLMALYRAGAAEGGTYDNGI